MNGVHVRLFSLLVAKHRAAAAATFPRCCGYYSRFHQTVFQFVRSMATVGDHFPLKRLPPGQHKRQMELLRFVKSKEGRSKRADRLGPSTVYIQVLGAGSRDNSPSVYVFSEFNRYLFNCGEGTQRLLQEHKVKASQFDNIFLPRVSWDNVGGLSGMLLTLKDIGLPECVLSGPPQLKNYLHAIKSFAGSMQNIKLTVRSYSEEPYEDETMTVRQVPLFAELRGNQGESGRSSPSQSPPRRDAFQNKSRGRDSAGESQEIFRDPSLVVAFVCKLRPKKGNFLVAQAKELGLPIGTAAIQPFIMALKNGKSIMHEGKEIRPEQVCTPSDPGPVFIIVECPSEDFVEAVCTNQQLRKHQAEATEDSAVLVVHMTPESVLQTDQYKDWMKRFPSTTEHLILNEHVSTIHNISSHKLQTHLNIIHPGMFPHIKVCKSKGSLTDLGVPVVRAECLLKFHLRPVQQWQRDAIPSCSREDFVKEVAEIPEFLEKVEKCREICSAEAAELSDSAEKYPEIVFLGTGSALPMKVRNVSGTLVNISPSQSILLDCGEGTFSQLCRHYGDDVDEALSKISTVFISHLHADHHTGLLKLLYQRRRALTSLGKTFSPIFLVAPSQIMLWLGHYHNYCEEILHHFNLISNMSLCIGVKESQEKMQSSSIQAMLSANGLQEFQTCLALHCKNAFACSFVHQSGWKLAFSGDTMPCESFVHIGKDATVLIHEATLEDGLEMEALEKRHSTTSQAIGIGMKMNANFIMLNHFSQRYAKIPIFNEDLTERVGISFDHMRIRFTDFQTLPKLIPALKSLFAEELEELEERREKRELKSSRGGGEQNWSEVERGAKREQEEATDEDAKRLKLS
ncbi:zinc phosphodiesterase ELAC protein 2 [Nematolebias whitei]|uniref:zinc phosphodiesterase ELAC protein 2 n=1 Tax=Nematolebias whitei TaxID=451745 RepID=UPI00189B53B4|nr:zinc phosphodiesterase ELAC protein 2 [Nematolebias whitei]